MNLEDLFKWKGKLTILDAAGEPVIVRKKPLVLYQRVVGDAELMTARKKALASSKRLRRNLRDEASEDALTLLPDHERLSQEALSTMLVLAETLTLRRVADKRAKKPKRPAKPKSDATLEQQEKYETALDEYATKAAQAIEEELRKLIESRRNEALEMEHDVLINLFLEATIDSLCRTEMLRVFNSWCSFYGTYSDKAMTKRSFKSFKSFENATPELREQIIGGYVTLEIGGKDLKN